MIQCLRQAGILAGILQLCCLGIALRAYADDRVSIVPRTRAAPHGEEAAAEPLLRVDSSLVLIPARVTTAAGAPITNLQRENFALSEDGVQQKITQFAEEDAPVSVGVLLDISGSMKNKMQKVSAAAAEFFKSANPEDEFFLVEFNGRARLKIPFTSDWFQLYSEITRTRPWGLTSLLDAVHLALAQMKHARNTRRAIVILSDGGDNFSRRNLSQMRDSLMESGVQVYAMGVFDANYSAKPAREERNGPSLLDEVALETGGQDFPVLTLAELPGVGAQMAVDLRSQYVIGYSPANSARDGKYRRVNLRLQLPDDNGNLQTYYRRGYYAPSR